MIEWFPSEIEVVVIGNGEYPTNESVVDMIRRAPYVVCCDGGADNYYRFEHRLPDVVIGDGDSLSAEGKTRFADRLITFAEQESNDQTKAIRYLKEKGYQRILLVAATGKREDHTLGNISLLVDYFDMGLSVMMMTDYGTFVPAHNSQCFASFKGQQVSIFSFGAEKIKGEGLVYPLHDFTNWWQGTLNEATGSSFRIDCEGRYLIFRAF